MRDRRRIGMLARMHRWLARVAGWLGVAMAASATACAASAPPVDPQAPATVVQVQSAPPAMTLAATEPAAAAPAPLLTSGAALEVGGVRPGMTLDALRSALGPEAKSEPYDAVRATWEAAGYDTTAQIEFLVGFDTVLTYNEGNAKTTYPFWSIFAKDGRVSVMKLTKYVPGTGELSETGFAPSCYLTRDPSGIQDTFGDRFIQVESTSFGHTSFHYLERGITVLSKDGQIAVFDIYLPIYGPRRDFIAQSLTAPSGKSPGTP